MTNDTVWHVWQGTDLKVKVTRVEGRLDTAEVLDGDYNVVYTHTCTVLADDYANALASSVCALNGAILTGTLTARQAASAQAGIDTHEAVLGRIGQFDLLSR